MISVEGKLFFQAKGKYVTRENDYSSCTKVFLSFIFLLFFAMLVSLLVFVLCATETRILG